MDIFGIKTPPIIIGDVAIFKNSLRDNERKDMVSSFRFSGLPAELR